MTVSQLFLLLHEVKGSQLACFFQFGGFSVLSSCFELFVIPGVLSEVFFHQLLAFRIHKDDVGNTGTFQLFHDPLHTGLVVDGEHSLRNDLREGEETGSEAGDGDDGFHTVLEGLVFPFCILTPEMA